MGNSDLHLHPHHPRGRDDAWWYDEPEGITVILEPLKGGRSGPNRVTIPWRSIEAALRRKRKPEKRRLRR